MKRLRLIPIIVLIIFSCRQQTDEKIGALLDSAWTNYENEGKMVAYLDSAERLGAVSKAFYTLRGLSVQKSNMELSLDYFDKLLDFYPDDTVGYVYRAQSYMLLGEWEKAEKDFTTAINKKFSYENGLSECYYNRGLVRKKLQKVGDAKKDLEKAIEINPDDGMAYSELGKIAAEQNDFNTACRLWRKSLELGFRHTEESIMRYCN